MKFTAAHTTPDGHVTIDTICYWLDGKNNLIRHSIKTKAQTVVGVFPSARGVRHAMKLAKLIV